ncbi:MAG TPA: PPOX class F420-dependent oxidoreductase [Solirubrobacteraceae bacterium]|jgi:pyridoxamine 5'-phosphate oxidase family protein
MTQHAPQVVPVGFFVDEQTGDVSIGGIALGSTPKFRNVEATGRAALVIDDLASTDPWHVRGVEIRGAAEARQHVDPRRPRMSRELITIHPERIRSWGLSES